jgi:hypothetical protein
MIEVESPGIVAGAFFCPFQPEICTIMADPVIRLDKSKPFSECRGERQPDDPHYKVHFFQGFKNGKVTTLLPFDAHGVLVPDDFKTEPYPGLVEGKSIMHAPLYSDAMREIVAKLKKRQSGNGASIEEEKVEDEGGGDNDRETKPSAEGEEVNFESWLRGEIRYQPHVLRKAAKARYAKNYPAGAFIPELVRDLVLDEKLVPESELATDLVKFLPEKVA